MKPRIALLALLPLFFGLTPRAGAQSFSGRLIDAVAITLEQDASLANSRQQVLASEGAVLSARAPFDRVWNATASHQRNFTPLAAASGGFDFEQRQHSYKAGVTQRLENGLVVNPVMTVTRTQDNGANQIPQSSANVALNVVIPLLKGRGAEVNQAGVSSAQLSAQSARSTYRHTLAQSIARTVNAYWDLVAARRSLELAQAAQDRANGLEANALKLANAGEIPTADLLKYQARHVSQASQRLAAQQQVVQATLVLAQAMNVSPQLLGTAVTTLDEFPRLDEVNVSLISNESAIARLLEAGLERRADVRAAKDRARAARVIADAARNDKSNQLDLTVSLGYNGLIEGQSALHSVRALGQLGRGPNLSLSLNYTLPAGEFESRGLIQQREAAAEQARIDHESLRLRAQGDARAQVEALRAAIGTVQKASDQRALQTRIFENERRAYQAGLSTLLDLFSAESQLTSVQTEWVQALRSFAQALVLFRLQTASLVAPDGDTFQLEAATLVTLPDANP